MPRDLGWPGWCFAATLVIVGQILIAQNNTIGARLLASCMLVGPSWLGCIIAGVVVRSQYLVNIQQLQQCVHANACVQNHTTAFSGAHVHTAPHEDPGFAF
jgi:hypothetical protein